MQEILAIAKLGVHAHVDPRELKILNNEIGEVKQAIVSYQAALSNNDSSDKQQILLAKLAGEVTDAKSQADEIMKLLAAESNYYKLLVGFSDLPSLLTNVPVLQTKLVALDEAVDIRLGEMNLGYLLNECIGDIIGSLENNSF